MSQISCPYEERTREVLSHLNSCDSYQRTEEMREIFRHAVGEGYDSSMNCRHCWNLIREKIEESVIISVCAKRTIEKKYLSFVFSQEVLAHYCNVSSLPRR